MEIFGINTNSGSYHANFDFGNIEHLTYGLYVGDIILLILILFLLLGILGITTGFDVLGVYTNYSNSKNAKGYNTGSSSMSHSNLSADDIVRGKK